MLGLPGFNFGPAIADVGTVQPEGWSVDMCRTYVPYLVVMGTLSNSRQRTSICTVSVLRLHAVRTPAATERCLTHYSAHGLYRSYSPSYHYEQAHPVLYVRPVPHKRCRGYHGSSPTYIKESDCIERVCS